MNDVLPQTESGREIARRNRERGREEGRVDGIRAVLRARFGDLDDLAWRLAGCDGDIARIVAGATLGELRVLSCAQIARAIPIEVRQTL